MPSEIIQNSLLAALQSVIRCQDAAGIQGVVIGGVAASLLGKPRLTRDIDALVDLPEQRWQEFLTVAGSFGLEPRIEDPLDFARRSRVLLLRHVASQIDVDLVLSSLPFEREAIAASQSHQLGGLAIPLPRVEDLMILKAVAQRPRDVTDLEALLETHPQADLARVRQWVREFATAAAAPELLSGFDRIVEESRARR